MDEEKKNGNNTPQNLPHTEEREGTALENSGNYKSILLTLVGGLALIAGAAYGLALYFNVEFNILDQFLLKKEEPKGTIYLTLQPLEGDEPLTIYTFDVAKKELTKSPIPGTNITPVVREDGLMVFASFDDSNEVMQLFSFNGNLIEYPQLTTNDFRYKRELVWSSNGQRIAYLASNREETPRPEDWSIFLTDFDGNEEFLTQGTNPVFSPGGGSILYLKTEGLYLRDIETGSEVKVWDAALDDPISGYENLDLSHNKKLLAWSDHDSALLAFFTIESWSPFQIELLTTLPLAALDGAFSPNDQYYVSYVYDITEEGEFTNPELYIYDLDTLYEEEFRGEKYLDLSNFDQEFVWISDWN